MAAEQGLTGAKEGWIAAEVGTTAAEVDKTAAKQVRTSADRTWARAFQSSFDEGEITAQAVMVWTRANQGRNAKT